ncbi:uncharacterized protein BYT42DRAFT_566826 [Radiomyces spectabilis]|uniref:uncharacterized protein n=1 Tax=Radiomyces spectabilis TaxID=64574 RepID=UPI002220BE36|nr:uncharacterized protein BYT42DRAFT_566826 [Radiomyces spectabilis]KAI8381521.1 hypothetical protein BYT42DRAFT_566826 [Radiomyces spectabilis]
MPSLTPYRDSKSALSQLSSFVPDVPPTVAFVKRQRDDGEVDRDEMLYRRLKKRKTFHQVVFLNLLQRIHFNFTNERKRECECPEPISVKRQRHEDPSVIEEDIEMPLCRREEGEATVPPAWPVPAIAQAQPQTVLNDVALVGHLPEEAQVEVTIQVVKEAQEKPHQEAREEGEDEEADEFFDAMSFEDEPFFEEGQTEEEPFVDAPCFEEWMVMDTVEEMSTPSVEVVASDTLAPISCPSSVEAMDYILEEYW